MTYAPDDLRVVRNALVQLLDVVPGMARGADLEADEVGIVGDPGHAANGGYHEGNDDLQRVGRLSSDYSKRESPRDRPGSNAASALDIGQFSAFRGGRTITLRSLSLGLVLACQQGDVRTRDIREVIYSPDGRTVRRWDRLGVRSTGDTSHREHTHVSFFRDSEGRRHQSDNVLGLLVELIEGEDMSGEFADAALRQLDAGNALGDVYLRLVTGRDSTGKLAGDASATANLGAVLAACAAARSAAQAAEAAAREARDIQRLPAPVNVDQLAQALEAAAEAAVRRVLGAVDGAVPPATP